MNRTRTLPALAATALAATIVAVANAAAASGAARIPVSLALAAPVSFGDACCTRVSSGSWLGPEYTTSQSTGAGVRARIDWSVAANVSAPAAADAARRSLPRGWAVTEAGVIFVPHVVAGRAVGRIGASYFVAQLPGTARFSLAVAVPLGASVFARARLLIGGTRAGERASASAFSIGGVTAARWNADVLWSVATSLRLEGSLPPAAVSLRRAGQSFTGVVRDPNGHPVAGARVALQRRNGSAWGSVSTARSTTTGAFRLRVPAAGAGSYRVAARLAGVEARSAARRT